MHASSSRDIRSLETKIGYSFKRTSLLEQALTHKSFAKERPEDSEIFNERLEFLGDAVLGLIICEYLYKTYPQYSEAELSKLKSYAVQESTLAEAALRLNIGSYLRLGKGEEATGGRKKSSILADAFEALVAAIYLDSGLRNTKKFTLQNLEEKIKAFISKGISLDFKSQLQEITQERFGVLPRYRIKREKGPQHKKTFEVEVFIKDILYGSGKGKSKKEAEQKAAEAGLKKLAIKI
jgi:ribonuclease-3